MLSALLSILVIDEPHREYYSASVAYLFGFFYLPLAFVKCFVALGINEIIGIVMLIAYWPMSIFLTYKYIKKRNLKWFIPLTLIIVVPALKIGDTFIATMSI